MAYDLKDIEERKMKQEEIKQMKITNYLKWLEIANGYNHNHGDLCSEEEWVKSMLGVKEALSK